MNTTDNVPFFSKSLKAGTVRWDVTDILQSFAPHRVQKGYVVDAQAFGLPHRWFLMTLRKGQKYVSVRSLTETENTGEDVSHPVYFYEVFPMEDVDCVELEVNALAEVFDHKRLPPVVDLQYVADVRYEDPVATAASEVDAVQRFERLVSNVMHRLLEPSSKPKVLELWQKILITGSMWDQPSLTNEINPS